MFNGQKIEKNNKMVYQSIIFYIICLLLYFLSVNLILIIIQKDIVLAVCALIALYILSAILIILLEGSIFLAMLFIVIYVGAIMVLFLMIIMSLNIRLVDLRSTSYLYLTIGFLLLSFFVFLTYSLFSYIGLTYNVFFIEIESISLQNVYINWLLLVEYKMTNIHQLGLVLYNKYSFLLVLSALLLIIATIGSIFVSFVLLKDLINVKIKLLISIIVGLLFVLIFSDNENSYQKNIIKDLEDERLLLFLQIERLENLLKE